MRRFSFSECGVSLIQGPWYPREFSVVLKMCLEALFYSEVRRDKPRVKLKNDRDVSRPKLGRRLNIKEIIKSKFVGFISGKLRYKPLRHNQNAAEMSNTSIWEIVWRVGIELAKPELRLKVPERYKPSICNLERNRVRM